MINANFYRILQSTLKHKIFIFKDYIEAREAYEVCKYKKLKDKNFPNFYLLNDFRAKKGDDLRSYSFELGELLINLARFYNDKDSILLSPLQSLLHPLPKKEWLEILKLESNKSYNLSGLIEKLVCFGYERQDIVYAPKELAIHGDIIDIFPQDLSSPIRIAFFDDEIEDIRYFDVVSQKCFGDSLDSIEIFPALFSLSKEEYDELESKVASSDFDAFIKDIHSSGLWLINEPLMINSYKVMISPSAIDEVCELESLDSLSYIDFASFKNLEKIELLNTYSDVESSAIANLLVAHKNKKITIITQNELILNTLDLPKNAEILLEHITLNILTPNELIVSLNKIPKERAKRAKTIRLNEINNGDYVVHSDYGIGIFRGLVQANVLGSVSDFIEISYLNNDKLLLPTHNLNLIDKYISSTSSIPMLDKLGKGSFAKIKEKVRPKLFKIAQEIIDIAAERELIKGRLIDTTNVENLIFRESSGFELTTDQIKSIDEIFRDLSSGKVMDRLLVGDVGFGKTEVAMNAIFATIKSGYQAALIVPTTLLSNQHFNSLKDRFASFDINIAKLDRFQKHKDSVLRGLENGSISLVVGTHGVLNAKFHNLALVVLDEEHKFGVKQKEKLKSLTKDVHILSMSATPIPRTLNLALSHIKTQSSLNTPPSTRVAPKTFVKDYSSDILKDAILRELRRNGQIFYIHNNIASIYSKKEELLKILPKLKIAILHSKIAEKESEDIMIDFSSGKYDMLLSTSIVESGIHLPNANTIIVDSADCFGMADLHQLRGRIGRGDKEGYCYFFVDNKEMITKEARKRLISLESNSFLGSGGVLSYSDLEIRGGGNILGEAQSGHIDNIGYSLYLKMLEESINLLSGKAVLNKQGVDIKLSISAFLNPSIIPSDRLRLDLYRRLANVQSSSEIYEIESEIGDRFGRLDSFSKRFLQVILIKFLANNINIKTISNYNQHISISFYDETKEVAKFQADEIDDDSILESTLIYLRKLQDA